MRWSLLAAALFWPLPVKAQPAPAKRLAELAADLDGDARPDRAWVDENGLLHADTSDGKSGQVELGVEGWRIARASLAAETYTSRHVVLVTLTEVEGGQTAVLVERERAGRLSLLWTGRVGAQDKDGEWSAFVALGARYPLRWDVHEGVERCDGQAVRQHPAGFDFTSGSFRPVRESQPLPVPKGAVALTGKRGDAPAGLDASTRPQVFRPSSATSTDRDGGRAEDSTVPGELDDGQLATAWVEGRGSFGRGELVSFRARARSQKIVALRIWPGDAASAAAWSRSNRLRRVHLVTESAAFVVELPDAGFGEPLWIRLPQPVAARCLSLVVDEVWPGGKGDRTVISELSVLTELDAGGAAGLAELAERVASGTPGDAQAAQELLAARGPAGAQVLLEALRGQRPPEQARRLRLALAGFAEPLGADELVLAWREVAAGRGGPPAERERRTSDARRYREGLARRGDHAAAALSGLLADDKAPLPARLGAAELLADLPSGRAALEAACGAGPRALRQAVTAGLGRRDPAVELTPALAAATSGGDAAREADLWRVVALLAGRAGAAQPEVARAAAARLPAVSDYERRHRLIEALAATSDVDEARAPLLEVLAREAEPALRAVAAAHLARHALRGGDWARQHLVAALADADPGVRAAAASGFRAWPDAPDADAALALRLRAETWPELRRGVALALGDRCARAAAADALAASVDQDRDLEVRRAGLAGLVRCKDARVAGKLLAIVEDRKFPAEYRRFAAAQLAFVRAPAQLPRLLALFQRARRAAFDDPGEAWVASALATTLGGFADPRAGKALADAAEDASFWPIQAAAVEALGASCAAEGRRAVRRALDADEGRVVGPARRAVKKCGW